MKKIISLIISMVFLIACVEQIEDTPPLKDAGTLEVQFVCGGNNNFKGHTFTPIGQSIDVEVRMNVEVGWSVSSDKDWCIVDEEAIYHGNGVFTISVLPNPNFKAREEEAKIVFKAGDFKTSMLISQSGNVFSMNQVYKVCNRTAGSVEFAVGVRKGLEWDFDLPEDYWIEAQKIITSQDEQSDTYSVTLKWHGNEGKSRFGTVGFVLGDNLSAEFSIYQFGDEYETMDDGTIILHEETPKAIEVKAPAHIFSGVKPIEWITTKDIDNGDNTVTWQFNFQKNESDTESNRETKIEFLANSPDANVRMPVIIQKWCPAYGLRTAEGFKMFADRFNSDDIDISTWEYEEGKIRVLEHVDLSELKDWTPIGTTTRPFNLEFDGALMELSNFRSSSPLFGVCQDATISNVRFDETCLVVRENDFTKSLYLAPLAEQIINTDVINCTSSACIEINASSVSVGTGHNAYMSGLVGYADSTSTIKQCSVSGKCISHYQNVIYGGSLYIGGVAALSSGNIENCESSMAVTDSLKVDTRCIGGIVGFCDGGTLNNVKNKGAIRIHSDYGSKYLGGIAGKVANDAKAFNMMSNGASLSSTLRSTSGLYVGGLVGYTDTKLELDFSESDKSTSTITVVPSDKLYVGGMVGYAADVLSLSSPQWNGTVIYDISSDNTTSQSHVSGLVGCASSGLKVKDAQVSGKIAVKANNNKSFTGEISMGGVVATASDGAEISRSVNNSEITWSTHCAKSDASTSCVGGISGRIDKGISYIRNCQNNAYLLNCHLNNSAYAKGQISANRTGGIIGCYGYELKLDKDISNITISECTNTKNLNSKRGLCGGIAGALINATVENCKFSGSINNDHLNTYAAGIAAAVERTQITECDVVSVGGANVTLYGQRQNPANVRVGGIVANLYDSSSVSECRFYGNITTNEQNVNSRFGGIAGVTELGCTISKCGFGGIFIDTELTKDNFADYIYGIYPAGGVLTAPSGRPNINPQGCYYWNGK